MKLLLPVVFKVLTTMEISGSTLTVDAPCSFESFCTHLRNSRV